MSAKINKYIYINYMSYVCGLCGTREQNGMLQYLGL